MREFSAFEKALLKRINSGQGNNLPNLIDPYLRNVSISVDTQTNVATIFFERVNQQLDDLPELVGGIVSIILQAVNLIKLFEDKGYLFTYTNSHEIANPFTYGTAAVNAPTIQYAFPDKRISELLTRYSTQDIFVTPELNVFIEDGFIQRDEKRFRRQFGLAKIALIIALSGVFINGFFNIKKEWFSDDQKFEASQFQNLLNHIDSNSFPARTYRDSLINKTTTAHDTTVVETVIATETTTQSTIKQKKR